MLRTLAFLLPRPTFEFSPRRSTMTFLDLSGQSLLGEWQGLQCSMRCGCCAGAAACMRGTEPPPAACKCAGTLPAEGWAGPGLFPRLQFLYLQGNGLDGALPPEWAVPDAFPKLIEMCGNGGGEGSARVVASTPAARVGRR